MPSDATTFFAAFAAIFAGLGVYLWSLERRARRIERRLERIESGKEPEAP